VQGPQPDPDSGPGYTVHDDVHLNSSSASALTSSRLNEDADTSDGDTDTEFPELGDPFLSESDSESRGG
jgi:hypothetical protein